MCSDQFMCRWCLYGVSNVCAHVDIDEEPVKTSQLQTESETSSSPMTQSAVTDSFPVEEYDAKPPLEDLRPGIVMSINVHHAKLHAYMRTIGLSIIVVHAVSPISSITIFIIKNDYSNNNDPIHS